MSSYTHFNIRFIPKTKRLINQNDLESLKRDLFSNSRSDDYNKWISSSWSGMFIFEIDVKHNCVALELTPIRANYLTDILDDIRDKGEFEIRAICTWEEGNDWLEIFNNDLKSNHSATCIYELDELKVIFSSVVEKEYLPKGFFQLNDNTYGYKKMCSYHAHCEAKEIVSRSNSLEDRCRLIERDSYILSNCRKVRPESNWYSNSEIMNFMNAFEQGEFETAIERVEFFYREKLVRLYDNKQYDECYMLENWFNLNPVTYDNLK